MSREFIGASLRINTCERREVGGLGRGNLSYSTVATKAHVDPMERELWSINQSLVMGTPSKGPRLHRGRAPPPKRKCSAANTPGSFGNKYFNPEGRIRAHVGESECMSQNPYMELEGKPLIDGIPTYFFLNIIST
jgi:hypothetical protein